MTAAQQAAPGRAGVVAAGRTAETRLALIRGTLAALREDGFAGASTRRIAARAGCNQALICYHFGSLHNLLIAALEHISAERMDAYRELLGHTGSLTDLVDCARVVFAEDLDAGHVTVLVEMISGAQSVPGFGARVAACLAPWRDVAETAIRRALQRSPAGRLLPAAQIAHGVTAGILGLELLASLDGDRASALELFGEARKLARLLDRAGPLAGLLNLLAPQEPPAARRRGRPPADQPQDHPAGPHPAGKEGGP
jgi:AcrR family transcriptional regulator